MTASSAGLASITAEEPLEVGERRSRASSSGCARRCRSKGASLGSPRRSSSTSRSWRAKERSSTAPRVDPAAEFELSDVGPGPWELTARLRRVKGPRIARARAVVGKAGSAEPAEIVFPAGPPLTLRGQVAEEGAGLRIELRQEDDAQHEPLTSTVTDEAGEFVFAGLGAGRYVLAVRDPLHNEVLREVVVPLERDRTVRIATR